MNQVIINVLLSEQGKENDILLFKFPSEELQVNLNTDSCQSELKAVFSNLLRISMESEIILSLEVQEGYSRRLYVDVCEEYIKDLQKEIDSVKEKIRKELQ